MMRLPLTFIVLLRLGLNNASAQERPDDAGFHLVKHKDNISIYERWSIYPNSNPPVEAREVKGVFYAKTTLEEALALLTNEGKLMQWQSHVSKFKVYRINDTCWYEYSYHDVPWPVSDQDHFLQYKVKNKLPGQEIFVTFESVVNPELAPVDDDADRISLSGSWLFQKEKDRIKITYRIFSMPSHIPRMITDPVIRSNMMSTIKSFIEIVEKKK